MTSAPASPSIRAASGPGSNVVKSSTTMPDSGCGMTYASPVGGPKLRASRRQGEPARSRSWAASRQSGTKEALKRLGAAAGLTYWRATGDKPMKLPRNFYTPLAIGAPAPLRDLPVRLERMIHFVPPHNDKVRAKVGELVAQVDVVLGNLEDAVPADQKLAARAGFIAMAKAHAFGATGLWTRVNALNSPWALDDIGEIVAAVGNKLDVIMLPKVEGPWDIHYLDQPLAQLQAQHLITQPVL